MNILYIIILFFPFLGGCSWWNQPTQERTEAPETAETMLTVSLDETDVAQEIKQDIKPIPEAPSEQREPQYKAPVPTIVIQEKPCSERPRVCKPRRCKRRIQKKAELITQPSKQPKTIVDLAQQLPQESTPAPEKKNPYAFYYKDMKQASTTTDTSLQTTPATQERTITIRNTIDKPMLSVKHWTGTYVPTLLKLTINDQSIDIIDDKKVIPAGDTLSVKTTGNTITTDYEYEFMNGMRKGSGSTVFDLEPGTQNLNMTFTWDTKWHVEFDKATPQK